MMSLTLQPHQTSSSAAVSMILAEAQRPAPALLRLRFVTQGDIERIVLPSASVGQRADELWQTTCFEAFVGTAEGDAYVELNFAPSTQWAAYAFDRYRRGMRPADVPPPRIETMTVGEEFELTATVDLSATGLPLDAPWRVGLSAVIEARGGAISYWALAHPPGKPDFHSPDCLALELRAPERP